MQGTKTKEYLSCVNECNYMRIKELERGTLDVAAKLEPQVNVSCKS